MSSSVGEIQFDLTPAGLFPNKETATQDNKCVIISRIYQEMQQKCDMSSVTQEIIMQDAANRYEFLSNESLLSLPQADHGAFLLYQQGVDVETAKEYFSLRLCESDARKWSIVIC